MAGKVAVVTGATRGLGRHTALALGQAGCRVVIVGRSTDETRNRHHAVEHMGSLGGVTTSGGLALGGGPSERPHAASRYPARVSSRAAERLR
jgi:NAD(P)-dependent dehydrogenase (short-subunit alcohol dehydrogenase family)